jgi:hypothetical protein
MQTANVILEYLKVLLSPQVVIGILVGVFFGIFYRDIKALIQRIASIKLPGGAELSTPQSIRSESAPEDKPAPKLPETEQVQLPVTLEPNELESIRELFNAERARAYLWEYRYLNYFLAYRTQQVLDWLNTTENRPSTHFFDTMWMPSIPSPVERNAIITALQAHHLIAIENDLIEVTPKGKEYIDWRGPLPKLEA